ncbi:MAG TPA: hypothetical protein VD997_09545 [Phycisphaerales bacterium]|nr:hypothetical protein [Phycisphaerales bacterium]
MTLAEFLAHHRLTENPFRGEEARSDPVFGRMSGPPPLAPGRIEHSHELLHADFEKIVGDLRRPSSSVVFGEKGSGKTAIRMQIASRVAEHNLANPGAKVLLVAYDDLNGVLDRIHERVGGKTPLESLQKVRLVDHLDAVLAAVVPRLSDAILAQGPEPVELPADPKELLKRLDITLRRDLLLLQALYDRPENAAERTIDMRRRLKFLPPLRIISNNAALVVFPLAILAALLWTKFAPPPRLDRQLAAMVLAGAAGLYAIFALKVGVWDRWKLLRTATRLRRQIRVVARRDESYGRSLREMPPNARGVQYLPVTDSDEPRYGAIDRLRRVLRALGYVGLVVIVDRVDEPTLISGDPDRMKAVIWPMLNNKFLQQESIGFKLLLPVELRHAVFRESSAFFQEARLDKQHFVENLQWTGTTLFDLCNARIAACTKTGEKPPDLMDLFAEDVTRQELLEALERLHQPRDAFKLLYRCVMEHCASVTAAQNEWKIPRHTLTNVLKSETERVQQMYRGIRPA